MDNSTHIPFQQMFDLTKDRLRGLIPFVMGWEHMTFGRVRVFIELNLPPVRQMSKEQQEIISGIYETPGVDAHFTRLDNDGYMLLIWGLAIREFIDRATPFCPAARDLANEEAI